MFLSIAMMGGSSRGIFGGRRRGRARRERRVPACWVERDMDGLSWKLSLLRAETCWHGVIGQGCVEREQIRRLSRLRRPPRFAELRSV